jgi:hypothetical protein
MRTFIQLRNGIGFATLNTPTNAPDHTVTPDHTTAIEVFTDNPEQFLKMKYDAETKSWSDCPVFRYAEINTLGEIIEIKRTVFEHEIDADTKLMDDDTTSSHKWVNGAWVAPTFVAPIPAPPFVEEI